MAVDTYQPTGDAAAGGHDTERTGWTGWIVFRGRDDDDHQRLWALTAHGQEMRQA